MRAPRARERAPPRVRSARPPWPGARSRPRVEGIERYWAGTGPRAGIGSKDAEGSRDPGPSLIGAGRAGGIPRASRRDSTGPARESWCPTPGAAPAQPRDPGEGRGEPPAPRPAVQPAVPGPAECTISGDGGGPARGRGRGALAQSRWGGGGRSPPLGRRTVGNRSKLPSSNFIEEAPETDKLALLIPGCFKTPANGGLLGASVSFWFWSSSARFSVAFVAQ